MIFWLGELPVHSNDSLAFHEEYTQGFDFYKHYASVVSEYLTTTLQDAGFRVHAVFARAKDPQGLLEKMQRKAYDSPRDQITDLVGARIITYYSDEVDGVATFIRGSLATVDEDRSVDKRSDLSGKEFGYRSVHVIGTLPEEWIALRGLPIENPLMFEVQIRSLLEHAWAQIEHEVVYKAGINYPGGFLRRFHAIAGTLEMLDREFIDLREHKHRIIDAHKDKFQSLDELQIEFDSARLIAFLEVNRPHGLGWRIDGKPNKAFAPHSENACVSTLKAAGLSTPQKLLEWLGSQEARAAVERFAADAGSTPSECSHYALCLLAAATADPSVPNRFPNLYGYELATALAEEQKTEPSEAE